MTTPITIIPLELSWTQHNIWQESLYSANYFAPRLITVCTRQTNGQWRCSHSILPVEPLPTKDFHEVSTDPCLFFWSFMPQYLDLVVKADQCAQNVDYIGSAANNATDLTRNIWAVFECNRRARLKLTTERYHFGFRQLEYLGRTISPEETSPPARKIHKFPDKFRFPKSKQHYSDNFFR